MTFLEIFFEKYIISLKFGSATEIRDGTILPNLFMNMKYRGNDTIYVFYEQKLLRKWSTTNQEPLLSPQKHIDTA